MISSCPSVILHPLAYQQQIHSLLGGGQMTAGWKGGLGLLTQGLLSVKLYKFVPKEGTNDGRSLRRSCWQTPLAYELLVFVLRKR